MRATFEGLTCELPDLTTRPEPRAPGLRAGLMHQHGVLEALFEQLLAASEANAREDVAATWAQLEHTLEQHLGFEEQAIFPQLAKVEPDEVASLAREHWQLRRSLAELGIEVDLHVVRHASVRELVAALRRHALREDALMYRWAEQHLVSPARARAVEPAPRAER